MVFPNFFITFVRHSFHTSHPCTSPSRERRHRPAPRLPPGTTLPSWHTRCLTRCTLQRGYAHALRILVSHSTHALHTTTPAKGYATRAALPHSTHALHTTTPAKGYATHTHTHKNAAMLSLAAPSFLRRKSEPPQPKYYILQYYICLLYTSPSPRD